MNPEIFYQLCKVVGSDNVYTDEPLKRHTTFRIGGIADYYVLPHSKTEIIETIQVCERQNIPYYILGNGSNLLVSDKGYRGVIIQIYKNFSDIKIEETKVMVQAGASLKMVAKAALEAGLGGFEFAAGIPGTMGGAVVMNAGAYGGEMKDIVTSVVVLTKESEVLTLEQDKLDFGYRTSVIEKNGYIVLRVVLQLQKKNPEEIRSYMEKLKEQRISKQPLDKPSAGSTFKRPKGYFAGQLIMEAGLRGFSIGDAEVSKKHCGFVINKGEAKAADVDMLIKEVSRRVEENTGVRLEPEVKRLGEF